jgi:hypothetical protein
MENGVSVVGIDPPLVQNCPLTSPKYSRAL